MKDHNDSDANAPDRQKIELSVLGYREDSKWVALVLEMDLRGYGDTFLAAFQDLTDLVIMQISFATSRGTPEMVWFRADEIWFERFAKAREQLLFESIMSEPAPEHEYCIAGIPIPPPHVIAALQSDYAIASS